MASRCNREIADAARRVRSGELTASAGRAAAARARDDQDHRCVRAALDRAMNGGA